MSDLYCDGGIVGRNPSKIGGTWAYCIVENDKHILSDYGFVRPQEVKMEVVTNNLTEMFALLKGLTCLPSNFKGTIYSDSQITLGRIFMGRKWHNIPLWMHKIYQRERLRFDNWDAIKYVLLQGHPTKKELETGIGSKGYPVSIHNKWCDEMCFAEAKRHNHE